MDAAIVAFAQKFSASLLSFRSVVLRNLRAPESSRVASRNAAPKAAPKALSIESADPVALFQARDYLFSQAQSLFSLFSNVSGVFADGNTADGAVSSAITDEQFAAALNACVPATDADAKQKVRVFRPLHARTCSECPLFAGAACEGASPKLACRAALVAGAVSRNHQEAGR